MERKRFEVPKYLPGEALFLKEIQITQGLLIILVVAMFVFITDNLYIKYLEYLIIIWFISLWLLRTIREGYD